MEDIYIRWHISECDKMYESIWGRPDETPDTCMCKTLIRFGVELTLNSLPDICIRQCERWSLKNLG